MVGGDFLADMIVRHDDLVNRTPEHQNTRTPEHQNIRTPEH